MKIVQDHVDVVMMELTEEEMTLVSGGWGNYGYGSPCYSYSPCYSPCVYAQPVCSPCYSYSPCYGYGW